MLYIFKLFNYDSIIKQSNIEVFMKTLLMQNVRGRIYRSFSSYRVFYLGIFISIALSLIVLYFATFYMAFATLAYSFMCFGVLNRTTQKIHSKFMAFAIAIDFSIVLTLEINRNAIKKALAFSLLPLQQTHIVMSSVALLFYFPIAYLGIKALNHKLTKKERKLHMRLGITCFIFRSIGFVLMFSMLKHI